MISESGQNINETNEFLKQIKSSQPSVRIEKIQELMKLDPTLNVFTKLVNIFHEETERRVSEMKIYASHDNYDILSRTIHRFKSTSYNLGAARAVEILNKIEFLIANHLVKKAQLEQLLNGLEVECNAAYSVLRTYLPI